MLADRIHDSLEKDTPVMRPVSSKPDQSARLVSFRRVGGLHHRYDWQAPNDLHRRSTAAEKRIHFEDFRSRRAHDALLALANSEVVLRFARSVAWCRGRCTRSTSIALCCRASCDRIGSCSLAWCSGSSSLCYSPESMRCSVSRCCSARPCRSSVLARCRSTAMRFWPVCRYPVPLPRCCAGESEPTVRRLPWQGHELACRSPFDRD